jgi:hypothetical protein
VRQRLLDSTTSFDLPALPPGIDPRSVDSTTSGLGLVGSYDSRDNVLTPHRGIYADERAMFYDTALGGDWDYGRYDTILQAFWDPHPRVVLSAIVDGGFSSGRPPFYELPDVTLRGVPSLRYQGAQALSGEAEIRWNLYKRWSVVGFAGVGGTLPTANNAGTIVAGGFGFRYLLARLLGLESGIDLAFGPEETIVYIQVGYAWAGR